MNSHQRRTRRRATIPRSRRIAIDLSTGCMTLRVHGNPPPEFYPAIKAMGEAALDYIRSHPNE